MNARAILAGLVCFGVLPGAASHLFAQNKKQADLPTATVTGEVKGAKQGVLLVGDGDQQYLVRVAPEAKKVDVTGEGDVSLLASGMFVRLLEVKWDKKGNIEGDIKKLELFTPSESALVGVDEGSSLVAGKISSYSPRGGKITVVAGKVTVKGTVAKDASVNVGVRGVNWMRLAKAGDSVTVTGKVLKAPMPKSPGNLIAEEVELKVTKPLAGAEFDKPSTKKKIEKDKVKEKAKE